MDFLKFHAPAKKLSYFGRRSGGVLLLVRKTLEKWVKEVSVECVNTVAVKLNKQAVGLDKDVLFLACYIAPEKAPLYSDSLVKDGVLLLEESVIHNFKRDEFYFVITGDFNARTGQHQVESEEMMFEWDVEGESKGGDDCVRQSKDGFVNEFGKSLLDFCYMFDLAILNGFCASDKNGECTFVSPNGSSVIDYFLVPFDIVSKFDLKVSDCIYSWHLAVECTLDIVCDYSVNEEIGQQGEEKIMWSVENVHKFKQELDSTEFHECMQNAKRLLEDSVDDSLEMFTNALCSAAACMVRTVGRGCKKVNDWWDDECEHKKKEVKRLLKRYQRCKTLNDKIQKRIDYTNSRREYTDLRKSKEKKFEEERLKKLTESVTDSKAFWSVIKSVNRKSFIYNNIPMQQWQDHFMGVFNDLDNNVTITENDLADENEEFVPLFNDAITKEEVQAGIKHLKSGKSAGPDKIVGEMLKQRNTTVVEFIVQLFNNMFEKGHFPSEWAKSIVIPLFKKGDTNNPDNYRGIALTSILSKVYTHVLNKRLKVWAENEEKIIEQQAGFRSNYSTIDHIFTLYSIVEKTLSSNSKLYVAFVDFKKAFDSVNRNALWNVLRKSGVNGKLYMALKAVYSSVLACVRVNGRYSDYFECFNGVKQGCLLSPHLFSFFINELAVELSKKGKHGVQIIPGTIEIFLLLFADDVVLLSQTVKGLQNQLNVLKGEADRLGLRVNLQKTNIIVFRKGGHLSQQEKWFYGTEEVTTVNTYKYLGTIFSTKLSLNYTWEESCRKGKRGVIQILKSLKKLNCTDCSIFWKLFDSQIQPILTYAGEIWGVLSNTTVERVHTYAIKRFLQIPIHSSNTILYGETGRYPLYIRTYVKSIKYWLKLLKLPQARLCRQAYDMMLNQLDHFPRENWASRIKAILQKHGYGIVWLSQGVGNERQFLSEFKDRLICSFKQNWHADLETNDKYRWFYSFKSVFQSEIYLEVLTDKWQRANYAKFRLRTLGFNANKQWFLSEEST